MDWGHVPFIVLIGSFVSMMFIYQGMHKKKDAENRVLSEINEKLKQRREKNYLTKLSASVGNSKKVLSTSNIIYFLSLDHYTHAYTSEGEFIVDHSIKKLASELDPTQFLQIHRSSIVALDKIDSIENGSQWYVKTRSGESLPVSRSHRKRLRESL